MSIELTNISKTYNGSDFILSDISVKIETGEFFAIVGPSGCGKSTLLRMIAGLIPISNGQLRIDDEDVTNLPPQERALTMVFQNYALFPFLNVKDNVAFGLKARKMNSSEINTRVNHALELVNLTDFSERKPGELSGGQRQRVALARAIASDAKICLMDEPLSNLDAQLRNKMRSEIRELQQKLGLTLIYVTHDQVEAMTMADRIMVLNDAKAQQIDSASNIYDTPSNTFVASFFGTPQMNLLPITLKENKQPSDVETNLKFSITNSLKAGNYLVGVRPNALAIDEVSSKTNAIVTNIEYLGTHSIVHAQLDNSLELRIEVSSTHNLSTTERVSVSVTGNHYIFSEDGQKLLNTNGGYTDGNASQEPQLQHSI
ncbi:ABC transporter ATP-binding protein [Lactobacillus sp. UCMA15818]|uniref:ABC transporter ATP-binding protein n=1 Tax=Lactobacillus sp. UCMA15818 TaxID=2583394 RepID=UPI0025B09938|nr:ABC transporter ATP-binding protein [Lactobacillus sp. UCMA15818]MDN2454203.1 ABC transporter ATP-binding protein [Lactobacillus sp. UCMA15818]